MVKRKIDLSPLAQEYLLEAALQAQNEIGALVEDLRTGLADRAKSPTKPLEVIESFENAPVKTTRRIKRHKPMARKAATFLPSATRETLIAYAKRHDGKLIIQDFASANGSRYNPNYLSAGMYAQVGSMRKQGILKKTGPGRYALKANAEKAMAAGNGAASEA